MPIYIKDSIHHTFDRIKSLHTRQQKEASTSTGLESLDTIFGGIHTGDLIVLTGCSDSYKTTLALQILIHNLLVDSNSTLLTSPTLSSLQITNRLIALTSGIPLDKISGGMLEDHEWRGLTETVGMLENSKLIISDTSEWAGTKDDFIINLRHIIERDEIKLVFIDPLKIPEKKEEEGYIHALKELAVDLKITIFAVIDIPLSTIKESTPSYSYLEPFGNVGDYTDALCFVYKETSLDPLKIGDEEVETVILRNYTRSCRLFVDGSTQSLVDESEYKSRYFDSVNKA